VKIDYRKGRLVVGTVTGRCDACDAGDVTCSSYGTESAAVLVCGPCQIEFSHAEIRRIASELGAELAAPVPPAALQ
jgi:hypothetical protein